MKDSGIPWLGKIPEHWEICSFKRLVRIRNGTGYEQIQVDEGGYPVIGSGGEFARANSFLFDGEAVFIGRKGTIDKPFYYKGKFWAIDTVFYCIPKKISNCKYYYYQATTFPYNIYITSTARPSLAQSDLEGHLVALPPLPEQQAIAEYLDERCGDIDTLIDLEERKLTELQAYKQAIINEAVTKGLNPNASMKDSGIPWLGKIPEHWGICKIKNVATLWGRIGFRGYTSEDINKDGEGAITLSPSNMKPMKMDYSNLTYLSWRKYYESPEIMIENGDLLMVKTGSSYGKVSYVDKLPKEATINPQILRIVSLINSKYLCYYMQTDCYIYQIKGEVVGGTIPTIAQEKIKDMRLPIPPLPEQQAIAEYLDERCGDIDAMVEIIQQKKDELKEYKNSVIYEYVTGKKEIQHI